jgi:hypothetical protein
MEPSTPDSADVSTTDPTMDQRTDDWRRVMDLAVGPGMAGIETAALFASPLPQS